LIVINEFPAAHGTLGDAISMPQMDRETFEAGYVAGWQSVRGHDDAPPFVPPAPLPTVAGAYAFGFARRARDAAGMS
jgi:hypothetical protein